MSAATTITTLLFSDIEGSARLWERDRERMMVALAGHDALSRAAVEGNRGMVVKMTGNGMFAAFVDPTDAVKAVLALQWTLADSTSTNGVDLRVRCGLHAGSVERRDQDFFGPPVNRAARIMAVAHGGQVLVSQAVVNFVREILPPTVSLRDLGKVRLNDLATPEHVYQLVHPELRQDFPALRSLEATPNNLPQQLTSFIGRERDLAEARTLVGKSRLVTLLGVGGLGKTRLALQLGAEVLDEYPDGVWLVELAPLMEERLVAQAVASVLGVKEEAGQRPAEALLKFVRDRRMLLVLDNCEHLGVACAELAKELLQAGPQLKILATSREPLHITGETTYQVPSLSVPEREARLQISALKEFEAVRLFVDRAMAAQPAFHLTDENAAAVTDICHRLDGIPLAIELAAARVRALGVGQIDARLSHCFRLLTGGDRTAMPRQRTLRACIDWSYDLLHDPEKVLLQRLSVFAGGWTLAAAEEVCAGVSAADSDVLEWLTSLHDKSLMTVEQTDGHSRYGLLETMRQYAGEKLVESGGLEAVRERHRDYFLTLAEEAEPQLLGGEQAHWLQRLEEEHENLRAALGWSLLEAGSTGGARLCGALQRFWWTRGHLAEGREWCTRMLAKAGAEERTPARAKALSGAGSLAHYQGDYRAARAFHEESLALRRELGDRSGIAASLNNLGNVAYLEGDYSLARARYEESLAIRRQLGDRSGIATSLNNVGLVALDQGDLASAGALHQESLAIARAMRNRSGVARSLGNLGMVALEQRKYTAARALFEECLAIMRELGDRVGMAIALHSLGEAARAQSDSSAAEALFRESLTILRELGQRGRIVYALEELAAVAAALGGSAHSARLWGAAERLRKEVGAPLAPKERSHHDRHMAAARAALGDDAAFDQALQEGREMTPEQAVNLALAKVAERP